ncbi:MAG: cyclodeaminase/cyclohydrolase family protein [Deltaproteobacteria bacterium]|nr:cyclodeaminase/cyclohydrolase family protein [Deltaproteobacteria bacterium]
MLVDLSITAFLEKTAAGSATPGGGSVAALTAACAAGLAEMVANLTIGKAGYKSSEADMKSLAEQSRHLRDELVRNIDRDSEAYGEVLAAFKLPKETEKQKQKRNQAIQRAFMRATSVPLKVAKDALQVLILAGTAAEKGNKNTVTDAAVAALIAKSALLSAVYNVKVNLNAIRDEGFLKDVLFQVAALEKEALEKEKEILSTVDKSLCSAAGAI